MTSNKKFMFFVNLHKSCSRNGDNLILLIKIGNAHKERSLSLTINNTSKKCKEEREWEAKTKSKMMVAAKW